MKRLFLLHLLTFAWIHLTSPRTVPSSFTMDEDDLYEKLTARRAPVIYPPLLLDHIRADETDTESIVTSLSQTSQLSQNYFTNRVNSVMLYTSTSSSVMSSLPPSSSSGLLVTTSSKVMLDTTALTTSSSINEDVIRCVPIAAHLEKWSSTGTASGTWLPITPTRTIHDTIAASQPEPRPTSATSSASPPGQTAVPSMSESLTVMVDGLPQTPQPSRTETSTASVQSRMHGSKTIPESKPEPESHPRPASATSSASAPGHTAVSSMSQPVTVMADGLPQTPQTSRTERSTASVQPRMHGSSTIRASTPMQSHLSQSTSDRNTSVVFILPTANRNIQEVTTNSDSRYGSTFLSLDTHPTTEPSLRSSVLLLPSNIYIQTSYALDGQYITVNTLSLQSASTTFNTAPSISISTSNALDQSSPVLSPDYVVVSSAFVHQFEPSHVTPSSVVAVPAVTQHFDIAADQNLGLHINRETDVTRLPQVLDPLLGVNAALNELSGVRQNKNTASSRNKSLLSILSKALTSMTTEPSQHTNSLPFRATDMFGRYLAQGADGFSTTTPKQMTVGHLGQLLAGMEALTLGKTVAVLKSTETTPSTTTITTTTTSTTTTTTTTTTVTPAIPDICLALCRLGQCPPSCVGRVSGWSR